jgi:hypothetical protein
VPYRGNLNPLDRHSVVTGRVEMYMLQTWYKSSSISSESMSQRCD